MSAGLRSPYSTTSRSLFPSVRSHCVFAIVSQSSASNACQSTLNATDALPQYFLISSLCLANTTSVAFSRGDPPPGLPFDASFDESLDVSFDVSFAGAAFGRSRDPSFARSPRLSRLDPSTVFHLIHSVQTPTRFHCDELPGSLGAPPAQVSSLQPSASHWYLPM